MGQFGRRGVHHGRIAENDGHLPIVHCAAPDEPRLLIIRSRIDHRSSHPIELTLQRQMLGQRSDGFIVVDDLGQLLPGQLAILLVLQRAKHFSAPLPRHEAHNAGRGRGRNAGHVEMAGQIAGCQRTVQQDAVGPTPVGRLQIAFLLLRHLRVLILDQVAERIAVGPGAADQLLDHRWAAQTLFARGAISGQCLVVPADGPADGKVVLVDPARCVMRRRDASGHPVLQAAQATQGPDDPADTGARLAL